MKCLLDVICEEYEKNRPDAERNYADFVTFARGWMSDNRPVAVSHNAPKNLVLVYPRGDQFLVSPEIAASQDPRKTDPRLRGMRPVSFAGPEQHTGPLPNPPTQNF